VSSVRAGVLNERTIGPTIEGRPGRRHTLTLRSAATLPERYRRYHAWTIDELVAVVD
jgi:hypothetical protein